MEMLERLANEPLPVVVSGVGNTDLVRILVLAGHVKATVSPASARDADPQNSEATVTAITPLGQMALDSFARKLC